MNDKSPDTKRILLMQKSKKYFSLTLLAFLFLVIAGIIVSWHNDIPVEDLQGKYLTQHSKFIEVKNTKVHYQEKGEGPTLVLIHGTASSSHTWEQWIEILSSDFRVIAPDLPGFGMTGPRLDGKYGESDMLDLLDEFINKLAIDSLYLAGNSLGGFYTWKYAAQNPDKVKKMMVSNSLGYPSDKKKPLGFRLASSPVAPLLKKLTPRFLIEQTLKKSFVDESLVDDKMVDRYFELLLREGNRKAYLKIMEQRSTIDTNEIANINIPTLVMWGVLDEVVPSVHAFKFYRDLPISTLRLYPEVGHLPMEELPEASAKDLRQFLLKPVEEKKDLQLIPRDLS